MNARESSKHIVDHCRHFSVRFFPFFLSISLHSTFNLFRLRFFLILIAVIIGFYWLRSKNATKIESNEWFCVFVFARVWAVEQRFRTGEIMKHLNEINSFCFLSTLFIFNSSFCFVHSIAVTPIALISCYFSPSLNSSNHLNAAALCLSLNSLEKRGKKSLCVFVWLWLFNCCLRKVFFSSSSLCSFRYIEPRDRTTL